VNFGPQVYTGTLADDTCVSVRVEGDRIADVTPMAHDPALPQLLPVLVDLQHNGALGIEYSTIGRHGIDALHDIATFLRRHGVGRCLATLTTHPADVLRDSAARFDEWLAADADLSGLFKGIFHEGIYMSPREGWRGAHDPQWIRPPDWDGFAGLDALSGHRVRIVNVAPEEPGGLDFVERAVAAGKRVAIGHCCPDAATVHRAAESGASLVTHFGNGAAAAVPRFDNPFWAMLNEPRLAFSMIGDGFHLPPDLVGTVLRCKGPDGCYMVSDAAYLSACPPGRYDEDCAVPSVIEPGGRIRVPGSESLAGAWFQLDRSVEWLVETQGLSLREAWRYCSEIPAGILGEELPNIEAGSEASFVLARWNEGLIIEQSVHLGTAYLVSPIRPVDCRKTDQGNRTTAGERKERRETD